ncbi:uncharacterized protein LOC132197616 isoform X2 [Neocloeon triangulifer]|uniref:uncharacterized protein LOC132197616 isoform X2 n=1 Tax=Neocloeon triangulifer TaxID=2078957 RepID=UPI00286F1236|nr:uncharacterized protein LOC132197616 isoform X2 [Neocloeon triangulifer]
MRSQLLICTRVASLVHSIDDDARDLIADLNFALNNTKVMADLVDSMHFKLTDLREMLHKDVTYYMAAVIDGLDTLGVVPSQLLSLQGHTAEALLTSEDLLAVLLPRLINYRALLGHINEHLISDVAALKHGLTKLIEDTEQLISLLDSAIDALFSRYDLLREIILGLAQPFSEEELEEIEDLMNKTYTILTDSYTSTSLDKLAFVSRYSDAVTFIRMYVSQIHNPY